MTVTRPPYAAYLAYLLSDAWRRSPARLAELDASGRRCRLCCDGGPATRIEVHHRTYARIGRERPDDLTALCSECHLMVTKELLRRRAGGAFPRLSDTPRVLPARTLTYPDYPGAGHDS